MVCHSAIHYCVHDYYLQQAFAFFGMVAFGLLAGIIIFVIVTGHHNKGPATASDPSDYKEGAD